LRRTRGWDEAAWASAGDRLRDRGLLDGGGAFTSAGTAMRARIELTTDERALAPWRALGDDDAARLRTIVRPLSKAIVTGGLLAGPPAS
ncbi:MAG TPA: hypothetical protein VJM49_14225, partial [Acidimicrobiales bacterium]|nr:hypothetical protein [Acidimicrobiales bacterium]